MSSLVKKPWILDSLKTALAPRTAASTDNGDITVLCRSKGRFVQFVDCRAVDPVIAIFSDAQVLIKVEFTNSCISAFEKRHGKALAKFRGGFFGLLKFKIVFRGTDTASYNGNVTLHDQLEDLSVEESGKDALLESLPKPEIRMVVDDMKFMSGEGSTQVGTPLWVNKSRHLTGIIRSMPLKKALLPAKAIKESRQHDAKSYSEREDFQPLVTQAHAKAHGSDDDDDNFSIHSQGWEDDSALEFATQAYYHPKPRMSSPPPNSRTLVQMESSVQRTGTGPSRSNSDLESPSGLGPVPKNTSPIQTTSMVQSVEIGHSSPPRPLSPKGPKPRALEPLLPLHPGWEGMTEVTAQMALIPKNQREAIDSPEIRCPPVSIDLQYVSGYDGVPKAQLVPKSYSPRPKPSQTKPPVVETIWSPAGDDDSDSDEPISWPTSPVYNGDAEKFSPQNSKSPSPEMHWAQQLDQEPPSSPMPQTEDTPRQSAGGLSEWASLPNSEPSSPDKADTGDGYEDGSGPEAASGYVFRDENELMAEDDHASVVDNEPMEADDPVDENGSAAEAIDQPVVEDRFNDQDERMIDYGPVAEVGDLEPRNMVDGPDIDGVFRTGAGSEVGGEVKQKLQAEGISKVREKSKTNDHSSIDNDSPTSGEPDSIQEFVSQSIAASTPGEDRKAHGRRTRSSNGVVKNSWAASGQSNVRPQPKPRRPRRRVPPRVSPHETEDEIEHVPRASSEEPPVPIRDPEGQNPVAKYGILGAQRVSRWEKTRNIQKLEKHLGGTMKFGYDDSDSEDDDHKETTDEENSPSIQSESQKSADKEASVIARVVGTAVQSSLALPLLGTISQTIPRAQRYEDDDDDDDIPSAPLIPLGTQRPTTDMSNPPPTAFRPIVQVKETPTRSANVIHYNTTTQFDDDAADEMIPATHHSDPHSSLSTEPPNRQPTSFPSNHHHYYPSSIEEQVPATHLSAPSPSPSPTRSQQKRKRTSSPPQDNLDVSSPPPATKRRRPAPPPPTAYAGFPRPRSILGLNTDPALEARRRAFFGTQREAPRFVSTPNETAAPRSRRRWSGRGRGAAGEDEWWLDPGAPMRRFVERFRRLRGVRDEAAAAVVTATAATVAEEGEEER